MGEFLLAFLSTGALTWAMFILTCIVDLVQDAYNLSAGKGRESKNIPIKRRVEVFMVIWVIMFLIAILN